MTSSNECYEYNRLVNLFNITLTEENKEIIVNAIKNIEI